MKRLIMLLSIIGTGLTFYGVYTQDLTYSVSGLAVSISMCAIAAYYVRSRQ